MSYTTDGSSTYLSAVISDPGTTHTVVGWFYTTISDANGRIPFGVGDPGTFGHYNRADCSSGSLYVDSRAGGSTFSTSGIAYTTSAWQFGAFKIEGLTSRKIRLGTTQSAAETSSCDPNITRAVIGTRPDLGGGDFFNGSVAHMAIYDYAVSDADLDSLAGGANPMSLTTQPIHYWPLTDSGDFTNYGTSSGNAMTNSGATYNSSNPTVSAMTVLTPGAINSAYSGTTVTPVLPTHATGDVLIVAGLKNDAATALSVSGWTAIATESNANLSSGAWYKIAASGAESNPTITSTTSASSTAGLFGQCFKAPAASFNSIVNATWNGSPTSSTTPAGTTISTTTANALAVAIGLIDASTAFSSGLPPTGWTKVSDVSASTSTAPTVQAVSTAIQSATSGTTVTVTLPGHATNDILLVCGNYSFGSSTLTCGTSGWTKIDGTANANLSTAWFYKRAASGAETNPVITSTATASTSASLYGAAMVIRGCVTSGTPYEGATKSTTTSTSAPSTSAVTTTGPSRLAVELATTGDNNVETAPSGWTASLNIATTTGSDSAFFGNTKTIAAAGTESAAAYSMTLGPDYHQGLTLAFIPPDGASGRITTIEKAQASAGSVTGATIGTLAAAAYWKTVTFSLEAVTSSPSSFLARRPMPARRGLRGRRH